MAAKDSMSKASDAARAAASNQYIKRLIEDDELRGSLLAAYGAARSAYGRMSNGKPATQALFEDRKLQQELAEAAKALRSASSAFTEPPKKRRRKGGIGRSLVLLIAGATLALVLSEGLRSKVLDMLFGAEEEFDYTSTTTPSQPAPAPETAAAAS
jgi:ferric-dicitrate binding protein FerR (iron transport regulator)